MAYSAFRERQRRGGGGVEVGAALALCSEHTPQRSVFVYDVMEIARGMKGIDPLLSVYSEQVVSRLC